VDGIFSYTILFKRIFGIDFCDDIFSDMESNNIMVNYNRFLFLHNDVCKRLIDISNVTDICIIEGNLVVDSIFITDEPEEIDKFLKGYCTYHDIDFDVIYKKLIDIKDNI
jgi:hypothetical protein